jgi:uncharacterized membrane protein YjjB (DUF3815 family)
MTPLAKVMEWLFIAAWFVGLAGHIYGTRYFLPAWASGFRRKPEHKGYGRKMLIGYGIFIAAVAVGFAAGGVAELAGGWD